MCSSKKPVAKSRAAHVFPTNFPPLMSAALFSPISYHVARSFNDEGGTIKLADSVVEFAVAEMPVNATAEQDYLRSIN